ncbi:hypothetical protein BSFA1_41400 [Burkholderia sp. SFA1]|uniref:hypothetical protein n=1 Tax=unclassified Caballeronia TaxID=2646786 RepID=UPI001F17E6DB|nr:MULTISPECIES: hypothetical protein [unclassified Caballeronia]MCE4543925.1 hypothetical protein [Caballeronia sp. PC1]MCE4571077.1 hypothetical protein [Caballeronia sp. CLC5]BBP99011.1 hypothetical protein BSFA1_41400 [Burkholderia sp. SFA1]
MLSDFHGGAVSWASRKRLKDARRLTFVAMCRFVNAFVTAMPKGREARYRIARKCRSIAISDAYAAIERRYFPCPREVGTLRFEASESDAQCSCQRHSVMAMVSRRLAFDAVHCCPTDST